MSFLYTQLCFAKTGACTAAGAPHGGELVNTVVTDEAQKKQLVFSCTVTLELSERQACDVALLMFGGLSPPTGFMTERTTMELWTICA